MRKRIRFLPMLAVVVALPLHAEQYWVAWEGDDFPENEGWIHHYGNWEGKHQGQANRSIVGGVMTIDSLFDDGVYDFSRMTLPGHISIEQGEVFVMQWRLLVEVAQGFRDMDPSIGLYSDDDWGLGFTFGTDRMRSVFDGVELSYSNGVFHSYEIRTTDFRTYGLSIDGVLTHSGEFWEPAFSQSEIAWGDGVQGAASLAHWDYFRFGVIPEPGTGLGAMALLLSFHISTKGVRK